MFAIFRVSNGFWRQGLRLWRRSIVAGVCLLSVFTPSGWMKPAAAQEPIRTALVANDGGSTFDDIQRDAALVGVRVTIDKTWGRWDIIYSIQPIFRQKNGEIVRGAVHGADRGFELVSQAKPGYVVGRVEVSKGGMLDGMRCIFVRDRDGQLDPKDTYRGRWMGAKSEYELGELSGDGKYPIGIHGRSGDWLDGIGLVLAPRAAGK